MVYHNYSREFFPSADDRKDIVHCHDGVKSMSVGEDQAPVKTVQEWALKNGARTVVGSAGRTPTGLEEVGRCIRFLRSLN